MNKKFKLFKNEKGQSLVEFALVMPILMLILLGIIEFGWLYNAKITMTSAAREGARVYAIKGNLTDVDTLVTAAVTKATSNLAVIGLNAVCTKPVTSLPGNPSVKMAEVTVSGSIKPLVGFIVKDNVQMTATAQMRVEYYMALGGD